MRVIRLLLPNTPELKRNNFYVDEILDEWALNYTIKQAKVVFNNMEIELTATEEKSFLGLALDADAITHSLSHWYDIKIKRVSIF